MMFQAATWNSPAMNTPWALMSPPLMFRTCPFLIIVACQRSSGHPEATKAKSRAG